MGPGTCGRMPRGNLVPPGCYITRHMWAAHGMAYSTAWHCMLVHAASIKLQSVDCLYSTDVQCRRTVQTYSTDVLSRRTV